MDLRAQVLVRAQLTSPVAGAFLTMASHIRRSQALSLSFSSFFSSSAMAPAGKATVPSAASIRRARRRKPIRIIEFLAASYVNLQFACEHHDIVDITPNAWALNFPTDRYTMGWSRFIHLGRGRGIVPLRLSEMEERHGATRR